MPTWKQYRRGKPRIAYTNEDAEFIEDDKPSKMEKLNLKNPYNNSEQKLNENETNNDDELNTKMWKHVDVSKDNPINAPIITSEFAVKFPMQREGYLRMTENKIKKFFEHYGIGFNINFRDQTLKVYTTNKTWDPYSIIKGRDLIRLLSRHVTFEIAKRVMNDNIFSDIIELRKSKIGRDKILLIKRRSRLVGPNGVTLKAIELLTKCYILIHGYTVSVIGDYNGIKKVRQIVIDCMKNIHPIYQLKKLMTINELSKNKNLKNENWNRLLPTFKKIKKDKSIINNNMTSKLNNKQLTLNKIKKVKQKRKNKKYTPWPNDPIPSKIDIALETGQYWDPIWRKEHLKRYSNEDKILKIKKENKDILTKKN